MNRTMRKLLTVVMALALMLSMVAGAFAAEVPSDAFKLPTVKERIEEEKTPAEVETPAEEPAEETPVEEEQEVAVDEPADQPAEEPVEEPVADSIGKATVSLQDANSNLNIRAEGNTDGELLDKIANGEAVTVLAIENGWAKIRTASGLEGWVSASFLNIEEEPAEETPVEEEPAEETPVEETPVEETPTEEEPVEETPVEEEPVEETPAEEEITETEEVVETEPTEEPVEEEPAVEYVTDENGNLVLDENGNPIPVVTEEEVVEEEPVEEDRILRQVMVLQPEGETLAMYAEPSSSSAVVAEIPGGETIQVSEINADWSYAIYNGAEGYVLTDKIALMDDGMITPEDEAIIRTISITSSIQGQTQVEEGTVVTLTAKLTGFENDTYSLQWKCSTDGGASVQDIPGANGLSYSVAVTTENATYLYGLCVTVEE